MADRGCSVMAAEGLQDGCCRVGLRDRAAEPGRGGVVLRGETNLQAHLMAEHGGDGQTQAQVIAGLGALKGLEHLEQLFLWNLGASVADQDVHTALLGRCDDSRTSDLQHRTTTGRTSSFGGIFEELDEDVFQLRRIDQDRRQPGLHFCFELEIVLREWVQQSTFDHAEVIIQAKRLWRELGTATGRANALTQG